jgi:hypothetical protein
LFLLLAAEGRLAGPFPQFAGWGDIITGSSLPCPWRGSQRMPNEVRTVVLLQNRFPLDAPIEVLGMVFNGLAHLAATVRYPHGIGARWFSSVVLFNKCLGEQSSLIEPLALLH